MGFELPGASPPSGTRLLTEPIDLSGAPRLVIQLTVHDEPSAPDGQIQGMPQRHPLRAISKVAANRPYAKALELINALIRGIQRGPFTGIGKTEPLRFELAGAWSHRIDKAKRLVYSADERGVIIYLARDHHPR